MTEIWKPVIGYEGYYEVSNQGNIRCLGFIGKGRGKNVTEQVTQVTPRLTNAGYVTVRLRHPEKKSRVFFLHRLVASAFIGEPDESMEINHINGLRVDNQVENLEWVTRAENIAHARSYLKGKTLENPTSGFKRKIVNGKIILVPQNSDVTGFTNKV